MTSPRHRCGRFRSNHLSIEIKGRIASTYPAQIPAKAAAHTRMSVVPLIFPCSYAVRKHAYTQIFSILPHAASVWKVTHNPPHTKDKPLLLIVQKRYTAFRCSWCMFSAAKFCFDCPLAGSGIIREINIFWFVIKQQLTNTAIFICAFLRKCIIYQADPNYRFWSMRRSRSFLINLRISSSIHSRNCLFFLSPFPPHIFVVSLSLSFLLSTFSFSVKKWLRTSSFLYVQ